MRESDFQFTNPSVTYVCFKENQSFSTEDGKEINIGTNINVSNSVIDENERVVVLKIVIGEESEESPFCLDIEVMAQFRWNDEIDSSKVDLFLNQNAPALLLSYARPMVSMLTNASHFPAYNIPFIDFTGK